jgi:hypothetical protein
MAVQISGVSVVAVVGKMSGRTTKTRLEKELHKKK